MKAVGSHLTTSLFLLPSNPLAWSPSPPGDLRDQQLPADSAESSSSAAPAPRVRAGHADGDAALCGESTRKVKWPSGKGRGWVSGTPALTKEGLRCTNRTLNLYTLPHPPKMRSNPKHACSKSPLHPVYQWKRPSESSLSRSLVGGRSHLFYRWEVSRGFISVKCLRRKKEALLSVTQFRPIGGLESHLSLWRD